MSCDRCRDYKVMVWAVIAAHLAGGLVYLFVRLHSLGVI